MAPCGLAGLDPDVAGDAREQRTVEEAGGTPGPPTGHRGAARSWDLGCATASRASANSRRLRTVERAGEELAVSVATPGIALDRQAVSAQRSATATVVCTQARRSLARGWRHRDPCVLVLGEPCQLAIVSWSPVAGTEGAGAFIVRSSAGRGHHIGGQCVQRLPGTAGSAACALNVEGAGGSRRCLRRGGVPTAHGELLCPQHGEHLGHAPLRGLRG